MVNRKRPERHIGWMLALLLMALVFPRAANAESKVIPFDSTLLPVLDENVTSARDFTRTAGSRALLAAVLQFELYRQMPDQEIDVTEPIYLSINEDDIVTAALFAGGEYVLIYYTHDPLTTAYFQFGIDDPEIMEYVLEATTESLWEIPLGDLLEQLETLSETLEE